MEAAAFGELPVPGRCRAGERARTLAFASATSRKLCRLHGETAAAFLTRCRMGDTERILGTLLLVGSSIAVAAAAAAVVVAAASRVELALACFLALVAAVSVVASRSAASFCALRLFSNDSSLASIGSHLCSGPKLTCLSLVGDLVDFDGDGETFLVAQNGDGARSVAPTRGELLGSVVLLLSPSCSTMSGEYLPVVGGVVLNVLLCCRAIEEDEPSFEATFSSGLEFPRVLCPAKDCEACEETRARAA